MELLLSRTGAASAMGLGCRILGRLVLHHHGVVRSEREAVGCKYLKLQTAMQNTQPVRNALRTAAVRKGKTFDLSGNYAFGQGGEGMVRYGTYSSQGGHREGCLTYVYR